MIAQEAGVMPERDYECENAESSRSQKKGKIRFTSFFFFFINIFLYIYSLIFKILDIFN